MHQTNIGVVLGTHKTIISCIPIWAVGVPLSGCLGQPILSPKVLTNKTNYYRGQEEDLPDYPFLPLGEALGSPRAPLAPPPPTPPLFFF